jgi:hypothetical protein
MRGSFSHKASQLPPKTCCFSKNLKSSHYMPFWTWLDYHYNFYLAFGAPFAFLGCILYFHKIKGKETLSRSHNNLNPTDDNLGLTECFSASTELCKVCVCVCVTLNDFFLRFLLIYLFALSHLIKNACNKSMNKVGLWYLSLGRPSLDLPSGQMHTPIRCEEVMGMWGRGRKDFGVCCQDGKEDLKEMPR